MLDAVQFFKCLSDETRLHAMLLIAKEGELCVCELMEALDESQPKISRHLAPLRNCGILDDTRRGQWVYYSLAQDLPVWAREVLKSVIHGNREKLILLQQNLNRMEDRPSDCV